MRIDAYTHFIPERYFNKIVESGHADIGKRVREIPCIHDLDVRRKIVDGFDDYAQILSYPMPPLEVMTKGDGKLTEEYAKLVNDGFAEICSKYPDQFPGWVAQAPLIAPDAGVRECERALKNGALGVQIYTNIAGKPLDDPAFEPFFAAMDKIGKPIWMHPARPAGRADYAGEPKSKYEIWQVLGWPFETSVAMARLVFSGLFDKLPKLRIITHHCGGMIPYFAGRAETLWAQLGSRSTDAEESEVLKRLKKKPIEYFKMFYGDTVLGGAAAPLACGLAFFGAERVVFASDCPFDPEGGPMFIREGIRSIEELGLPEGDKRKIYFGNALRLLKLK